MTYTNHFKLTIMKYLINSPIGFFGIIMFYVLLDVNIANAMTLEKLKGINGYKETHIDNLSCFDNEGNTLNDNWVRIGNRYWFSNDLDEIEPDEGFGNLIYVLSYHINDIDSRYYGEEASLWIYDIESIKQKTGLAQDSIYSRISSFLTKDSTSIWNQTDKFQPFIALKTKPRAVFENIKDGLGPTYEENIIILANDRIYRLNISNNQIKDKGMQAFSMFDKRCLSLANSIDLLSYHEKEIAELAEKEIQEKKERQNALWIRIIYAIITLCGILAFVLSLRKGGKRNIQAWRWLYYIVICTGAFAIAMGIGVLLYPNDNDTHGFLYIFYLPAMIINSLLCLSVVKKAIENNNNLYLIPKWFKNNFKITNEFRIRLLMIILIFPFIVIVPLPVVGVLFLVFYILPVLLILGIIWIVSWIREGKKIDAKPLAQNDRARLYCRHCGKLIDADSGFCRYCGKKL